MQPGVERVHQDQTVLRKKTSKESSERAAVRFLRPVAFDQVLRKQVAALVRKQFRRFLDKWLDLRAKGDSTYWPSCFHGGRQLKTYQFPLFEPGRVTDLIEIVILRGHPKNRHGRNSTAR